MTTLPTTLPTTIADLFDNGETEYRITTDHEMDNVQSIRFFLERIGATGANIDSKYDTQVTLVHGSKYLVVDAGGLGDCYSHKFVVTEL